MIAAGHQRTHILLAEDSLSLRTLIRGALLRDGHRVTECATGLELLRELAPLLLHDEAAVCDLVISDEQMPGFSGLDILAGVARHAHVPSFILMTAFGDEHIHARARELGALAVFDKPFEIETLSAFVRSYVQTL